MAAMLHHVYPAFSCDTPDMPPSAGGAAAHEDAVRRFAATLPGSYRMHFSWTQVARHACIALARGVRRAHVDSFGSMSRMTPLCIVADDCPGLLWLISVALIVHRLDVLKAHVYCRRRPDGRTEAFDLIWVRRAPGAPGEEPISVNEIRAIGELLEALLTGRADAHARAGSEVTTPGMDQEPPRVTFVMDAESNASLLAIEAPDRPGLLLAIARALFEAGVQIVRAEVATVGARALDTFYVMELDGGAITPERRAEIEIAARAALRCL